MELVLSLLKIITVIYFLIIWMKINKIEYLCNNIEIIVACLFTMFGALLVLWPFTLLLNICYTLIKLFDKSFNNEGEDGECRRV